VQLRKLLQSVVVRRSNRPLDPLFDGTVATGANDERDGAVALMELSFLRGLVASVNPCGFVLLPTYLMFFLGMHGHLPGTQRASIRRALVVSGALTAGFLSVFVVAGLTSYHFTNWITQNAKYATAAIGTGFVVLGVAMLFGYQLPVRVARIDAGGGRTRGVGSMFVFGVAYAVASISCTLPLFLATLLSTRREGIAGGVANVAAYGLGMALVVSALTIALAVANTTVLQIVRRASQHIQTIAATFVVLSGLYLVYYFWVVDLNQSTDPITSRVERFQNLSMIQLSGNWLPVAVALGAIVVGAVVFVWFRRDPRGPISTDSRAVNR
jgi:cytochrome c-type biogenesis protein